MSEDMRERLAGIAARVEAVPKGPWVIEGGYPQHVTNAEALVIAECFEGPQHPPSIAEFITHAREDIPFLLKLAATCTCYDGNPANYEGPRADCPVHGAVRAFNEERAATDRVRALHAFEEKEWFTPCDRHQPYKPGVKTCPDCRTEVRRSCMHCTDFSGMGVRWPCPTVVALDPPGGDS